MVLLTQHLISCQSRDKTPSDKDHRGSAELVDFSCVTLGKGKSNQNEEGWNTSGLLQVPSGEKSLFFWAIFKR